MFSDYFEEFSSSLISLNRNDGMGSFDVMHLDFLFFASSCHVMLFCLLFLLLLLFLKSSLYCFWTQ